MDGAVRVTSSTRATLLARLWDRSDDAAWREFYKLYASLIYRYARARGLSCADAEEVRDQCLEVLSRKMSTLQYDREKGSFKNWLHRVVNRRVIDLIRKPREQLAKSSDLRRLPTAAPTPEEVWEHHWRDQHLRYCVEQVRGSVSPKNFEAFRMLLFEGRSVADVGSRLGMNANQVYKAKSRVLNCVRAAMAQLGVSGAMR